MEGTGESMNNELLNEQEFKYFAFISYNSKDTEWGKRIQHKLENYRMPATMCSERGWARKPIKPIFFAPTDIQPGGLDDELKERLRASRNLIVIGSPNSAKSDWVGKEIEYFHSLGRTQNIHYFIVDGVPHSNNPDTECFHPVIEELGMPEILGANIHEKVYKMPWLNKERAYVQLVSKLLGVEFDSIWQRHKRRLIRKIIAWTLAALAVLGALAWVWVSNQPFDAKVKLNEASVHNDQLPPLHNAVVTVMLDNESKIDTIQAMGNDGVFKNIPHRFLDKEARVTFTCADFLPVDTSLILTRDVTLNVYRDPSVYGNVSFSLWNPETETFIPNSMVEVAGQSVRSDKEGRVQLIVPLDKQCKSYQVKAQFPLYNDMITMPSGENDVVEKM